MFAAWAQYTHTLQDSGPCGGICIPIPHGIPTDTLHALKESFPCHHHTAAGFIHPRASPWCSVFDHIDFTVKQKMISILSSKSFHLKTGQKTLPNPKTHSILPLFLFYPTHGSLLHHLRQKAVRRPPHQLFQPQNQAPFSPQPH